MSDAPLVSCCLFTYNQASTAAEAVRSILGQTYAPMEIIIRDDCSKDGTVAEIQREIEREGFAAEASARSLDGSRLVGHWSGKGKDVFLFRNLENLGIIKSVHGGFAAAQGEFIIPAAGDDVSLPERTQRVIEAWQRGGRKAMAILHQAQRIDPNGKRLGPIPPQKFEAPMGCGTNFSPRIFRDFPPVTVRGGSDDWIFVRRARMLGEVEFIPDELVLWRVGSGVSSVLHDNRGPALRSQKGILKSLEQSRIDLEYIKPHLTSTVYQEHLNEIDAAYRKAAAYVELLSEDSFWRRYRAFRVIGERGLKGRLLQLIYVLPKPFADVIIAAYLRLKNF